ncbi:hypothetical protein PCL_03517 [Purpureocillium lilacinum]|uniref:Uncharacterized protein n=2 Tax=Purpureocillium lilacinum TaxID=33203 RepID=A0ACC4DHU2_PURLI|nr:hypothetical protein PCL_03517 [Purpureocillium lilacinum]
MVDRACHLLWEEVAGALCGVPDGCAAAITSFGQQGRLQAKQRNLSSKTRVTEVGVEQWVQERDVTQSAKLPVSSHPSASGTDWDMTDGRNDPDGHIAKLKPRQRREAVRLLAALFDSASPIFLLPSLPILAA